VVEAKATLVKFAWLRLGVEASSNLGVAKKQQKKPTLWAWNHGAGGSRGHITPRVERAVVDAL
jgi:hypothetical protein